MYNIVSRPTPTLTSWHGWGRLGFGTVLACPPLPLHLRSLNMSGANLLAGAHHFVASNNTFNEAKTVSGMYTQCVRQASCWYRIYCRSTSITIIALGRHPMGSFPLCQIRASGSQDVQKSLPNSRGIFFPMQMMQFKRESSFCYMEWGVLERLRSV